MRKNLDPFNEHTDEELWKALEEVTSFIVSIHVCLCSEPLGEQGRLVPELPSLATLGDH